MKRPLSRRNADAATGFTLLEVLIAMVVLAIGVLGLMALQTGSLRASHEAQFRTLASVSAQSFGEMIAFHGAPRPQDRLALLAELETLLPSPDVEVAAMAGGALAIDHFSIIISWDGRDDERAALRYIVTMDEAPAP